MALKVDFKHFLDEEGNRLELTEQANTVFKFVCKIVSSVSQESVSQDSVSNIIEPASIDVELKCNTRAEVLSCGGHIQASCRSDATSSMGIIEWHCDTCDAAGTISNWQGSLWDKQKRIIH